MEYEYDEQGNILKYTSYQNEQIKDEREYTYNGNVVNYKGIEYNQEATDSWPYSAKEEYEYVNNRKLLKMYENQTEKRLYVYDKDGNTISYERYANGEVFEKWYYEGNSYYYSLYYDNYLVDSRKIVYTDSKRKQILTEERDNSSQSGGGISLSKYKYDSSGNQIGYVYYVNNKLMKEYKDYVYDGNKVTYTEYSYWCNDSGILYHTLIYAD